MGKKLKIILGGVVIAVVCVAVTYAVNAHNTDKALSKQIKSLEEKNTALAQEMEEMQKQIDKLSGKVEYSDDAYNYLAIGNSITKHGITSYWWNECGMAASRPEKDYFHVVTKYLEKNNKEVCSYSVSFKTWEIQSYDRAETYSIIEPYLDDSLDLITIQLSENVDETDTFAEDFEELIGYIEGKAPKAQILVVDDFWDTEEKTKIKQEVSEAMDVEFLSLAEIKDNKDYRIGHDGVVYDMDGQPHLVKHMGVKEHPNDKGMKYIADTIIAAIKK